ncbi:MAG TPA: siderophore ABC transporter substrate-binding protein [Pseudogracilibacillus sp.]|nr:siderophore ABC transporter substrate-binding protein [Pseudogracilibacillus sp.]
MRNIFRIVLIVTISILLIACSDNTNENDTTKIDEEETIEVLHELDHDPVIVPKNPERVVVFDIGALDTLSFLGEEQRVVGLPQATVPNYLSEFASDEYENFGSLKEPEFEKIHAAQPDLIIISGRQMELYEQFREIAPTIYLDIDTHNYVNSFEQNARLLGEIFDKEDEIEAELETIQEKINAIKENVQSVDESALIVLGTEGKVSAYGPASRFGIIHDVFGIKPADPNIEESTHGQSITFEYILETNPDIIYIIDRDSAIGMDSTIKESFENDIVQKTEAYKNDRLIYLDGEIWYLAGGGLQSLHMMIDEIDSTFN